MRIRLDLRVLLAVGWLALPALAAYVTVARSTATLANAVLMVVLGAPVILVHVAAYVLAGKLAGVQLVSVAIGRGRPFLGGVSGNTAFTMSAVAAGTRPLLVPTTVRFARLRVAAVLLFAIGADLALIALLHRFTGARFDLAALGNAPSLSRALLFSTAWFAAWNVYPLLRDNDLWQLARLPFVGRDEMLELTELPVCARAVELVAERRYDDAEGVVRHARAQRDSATLRQLEANLRAERGDHAGAIERYRALLEEKLSPRTRVLVGRDLAWSLLHLPDAKADEALPLAEAAWRKARRRADAQCCYGAAQIVAGRLDDGVALCEMAFHDASTRFDAGRAAAWAAIAHARLGNLERATTWRDAARQLDPHSASFALAELAIAQAEGAGSIPG